MAEHPSPDQYLEHLTFLVSSFTDNGKSLRGFSPHPQALSICILTAGLLANSKLMISPDDAIKSAFDIHSRIQNHVSKYQNMQFVQKIDNCFTDNKHEERPPEVEHD